MIDTSALFVHVLAAIGMVSGGVVQVLAGYRIREARTGTHIASWAGFARTAGFLILVSAFLSLLTGGHLAAAVWTTETVSGFSFPFITLGAAGLILLAPIGPMVGGARLRRLAARASELGDAPAPVELRAEARAPSLWGAVHSLVGLGVGFVALMVYKPGWLAGALLLIGTFVAGWVIGYVLAREPS